MHRGLKASQSRAFSGFCENIYFVFKKKYIYSLLLVLSLLRNSNSLLISYFSLWFFIYFYHILRSTASFLNQGLLIYVRITALLVGSAPLIFLSPLCICSLLCENLFWIGMCQNCMQCSECGSSINLYNGLITFSILFSVPYTVTSDFFSPF